ncbi:hypothetical protein [Hungatella effluvii]|uniref:hypothetical protein n=1 Tax=Hungatella effluvii TaxID=1096246 RepID=UPI002A82F57E|nr:hypothetical protein [Hungatella effluvii]
MDVENLFKEYSKWKKDMEFLEFELSRFQGVPYDDVIESLCFSNPQEERVQNSSISDKTGKTALIYRQVKERMDDEWFEFLIVQYKSLKEQREFFEYAVRQLNGKLPDIIRDMVMEKMSWQELMIKYSVSHAMIGKYRKKAVEELQMIYTLRTQNSDNYMLS